MRTLEFFETDIDTINKHFYSRSPSNILEHCVNKVFANGKIVDTKTRKYREINHINAFYELQKELSSGKKLEDPLCLSYWSTNVHQLTVGKARMALTEVYKLPVVLIVDNFAGKKFAKKFNLKRIEYDTTNFIRWEASIQHFKNKPWFRNLEKQYRDIDLIQFLADRDNYQRPTSTIFHLDNDKVYCENEKFLEKKNNKWFFSNLT